MGFSWNFHRFFWNKACQNHGEKKRKLSGHCRRWGFALQPDVGEICGTNFQAGTWQLKWYRVCFLHAVCCDYDHPYLVGGIIVGIVVPNMESNKKCSKAPTRYHPIHQPFRGHFKPLLSHRVLWPWFLQLQSWNQVSGWQGRPACGCCSAHVIKGLCSKKSFPESLPVWINILKTHGKWWKRHAHQNGV